VNVEDSVIGIPAEKIEQIFERFSRVDPSYKGRYKGTGLGLSIVRQLVHMLGGEIHVKSQLGWGSSFWLDLPFKIVEIDENNDLWNRKCNKLRTLIIDDNKLRAKTLLRHLLSRNNIISNSEKAFYEICKAYDQHQPFQIIIIDDDIEYVNFIELAKKKEVNLITINISEKFNIKSFKRKVKKCDIIYCSVWDEFSVELTKTIEELGKKIIETSKSYYCTEDKWMFYVKCKKNNVPTPDTILLSENINNARAELKEFGRWPVVLKRISGTMGEYVGKAKSMGEAEALIRKFWKKGNEKLPIIAQEFVKSPSYRVTVIGNKIVQTALKRNNAGWKATGVYAKTFEHFDIDKKLERIIKKTIKFLDIKICGIDMLKKDGKWLLLEVNGQPALDFFEEERERLH
jgi:RimK family alpha-L-glutamate ligase